MMSLNFILRCFENESATLSKPSAIFFTCVKLKIYHSEYMVNEQKFLKNNLQAKNRNASCKV